jgi:hypothetical protein
MVFPPISTTRSRTFSTDQVNHSCGAVPTSTIERPSVRFCCALEGASRPEEDSDGIALSAQCLDTVQTRRVDSVKPFGLGVHASGPARECLGKVDTTGRDELVLKERLINEDPE